MNKKKAMARKMTTMKSMGGNRGEKYDLVANIMDYEQGGLDEKATKRLFGELNKRGLTNKLQGHYGRENARRNRLGLN